MKTSFQNNLIVCFDLHDTLLDSTKAWIKAFRQICKNDKNLFLKIKQEYLAGGWKREICKKYGYKYEEVKNIYLSKVKTITGVKKFCDWLIKQYRVFVITNATYKRALEDIDILKIKFEKVYSRDNGIKPDKDYIKSIMEQNNAKYMLMVGNEKERDIFNLPNTKTIIVTKHITLNKLKKTYRKFLKELNV